MKSKAGLRKITKSVRGKKGTVRRSYWVADQKTASGRLQKGLGILGSAAGARVGSKIGAVGGGLGGTVAGGYFAAKRRQGGEEAFRTVATGMGLGIIGGHVAGGLAGGVTGYHAGKKVGQRLSRARMNARQMNAVGTFAAVAGVGLHLHHAYRSIRNVTGNY